MTDAGRRNHADPLFDRYARIVREALGVSVALVSVVEADRQLFPGAVGLAEPWQTLRESRLDGSFCRFVVGDAAPLVIDDARLDPRVADDRDPNTLAYAGFPLRDPGGAVIGSVCAIDDQPRAWTTAELDLLADIAETCSTELALRAAREHLADQVLATDAASARTRLLLALSDRLIETITLTDVAQALQDVGEEHLGCAHAGIWAAPTVDAETVHHVPHPRREWPRAQDHPVFAIASDNPIGAPLTTGVPLYFTDQAAQDEVFPDLAGAGEGRGQARVFTPLRVAGRALGTLAFTWDTPRRFTVDDRMTIAALTSYTAQAVHRASLLAERASVAHTLQAEMLSPVPARAGRLLMSARYVPARISDEVGGDWYDAVLGRDGQMQLMVGDVAGHDVAAAAVMGSVRSMLRTLAWTAQGSPSRTVEDLDDACRDLGVGRSATLVFGRIEASAGDDLVFRHTNAGHVPPVVVQPDGSAAAVDATGNDIMLGVVHGWRRHDRVIRLRTGSTLVLYTDGLVETRTASLQDGIDRLCAALVRHRDLDLDAMLDATLAEVLGSRRDDDVAVLAVRVAPPH